jgi:branched-chain amino acid transport system substrate-binding protein
MGMKVAELAISDGFNTFGSITVNNPFGIGIEIWTQKGVEKHGKKWLTAVRYDERKTDYRAEVQRLFSKNPECVFFTAYGTESRLILKQAYEMGLKPTKAWYADSPSMWANEVIPESAEGIIGIDPGPESGDRLEAYKAAFDNKYGKDAKKTVYSWYAYDATWLAALALSMAGTDNPDQLVKALYTVSKVYNGATGDKSFDKDGMQAIDYYRKFVYKGGKLVPMK